MSSATKYVNFFIFLFVSFATTDMLGDEVCIEGYIMDSFCIERGTLFDNPSVNTLEGPEVHSIHCLVDVPQCVNSPFEILVAPQGDGLLYTRGYRVSNNDLLVELAQQVRASQPLGFEAEVCGKISSLGNGSVPPILDVSQVNAAGSSCTDCGYANTTDPESITELSPGSPPTPLNSVTAPVVEATTAPLETTVWSYDTTIMETATKDSITTEEIIAEEVTTTQVGDEVCIEGYIMDSFCIERGTLFDNPSVNTLEGPEVHSIHCLVDVPQCVNSPFEILVAPQGDGLLYTRGYRVSNNDLLVELAQQVRASQPLGFEAEVCGKISSLGNGSVPPILDVSQVNAAGAPCDDCGGTNATTQVDNISSSASSLPQLTSLALAPALILLQFFQRFK